MACSPSRARSISTAGVGRPGVELFLERLADTYPTILAFEDMQWADASLLDFVEYLR